MSILCIIFYKLLYMSLVAAVLGLTIIMIRRIFDDKIPPFWKQLMWLLVIIALVVPYRPKIDIPIRENRVSVSNYIQTVTTDINTENIDNQADDRSTNLAINNTKNSPAKDTMSGDGSNSIDNKVHKSNKSIFKKDFLLNKLLPSIWFLGFIVLLINYSLTSLRLLLSKNKIEDKDLEIIRITRILTECKYIFGIKNNISFKIQDNISSPAIISSIKPTILLPSYVRSMSDESISYVLFHELAHYKRKDTLINSLLLLCQIVYWFNPLVWLIFKYVRDDIEILTDEYVINTIGEHRAKDYSKSLVEVLANANKIPFIPKMVCMVDGKKNIERRITMIKLGEHFKKHKLILSILCLFVIAVLGISFLTTGEKHHDIAIYAVNRPDIIHNNYEYHKVIKDKTPVLTEKDIVNYNKDAMMFFLSDEVLAKYEQKRKEHDEPDLIRGGSLILDPEEQYNTFVFVINGEIAFTGDFQQSAYSSFAPLGFVIRDCSEGLRIYMTHLDEETSPMLQATKNKLEHTFNDMNKLTEEVFDLTYESYRYDTDTLWDNRTEFVGNNSKVGGILNNLAYPKGSVLDGFRIESKAESSTLIVNLKQETIENGASYFHANYKLFDNNSRILMALVGNVYKVTYTLNGLEEPHLIFTNDRDVNGKSNYDKLDNKFSFYKEFSGYIEWDNNQLSNQDSAKSEDDERATDFEIYVSEGYDIGTGKADAEQFIEEHKPVLTLEDITAYNKDAMMIFLSDKAMQRAYKKRHEEKEASNNNLPVTQHGGSDVLGLEGFGSFIIAVNGKAKMVGTLEPPAAVSYIPTGYKLRDCDNGLRLYYFGKDADKKMSEVKEHFATYFEDYSNMNDKANYITDNVFKVKPVFSESKYDINKLWDNRTEFVGDNTKLRNIVDHLVFPDNISVDSIKIQSDKEPYRLTINLRSDEKISSWDIHGFSSYYHVNSDILLALVGNLMEVQYCFLDSNGDIVKNYVFVESKLFTNNDKYQDQEDSSYNYTATAKMYNYINNKVEFYKTLEPNAFDSYMIKNRYIEGEKNNADSNSNINKIIDAAIEEIVSSPKVSSNPQDYIDEHEEAYKEIHRHGDAALDYMLSEFERGNVTGLKASIMAALCMDIEGITAQVGNYEDGNDWYEKYINRKKVWVPVYTYKGNDDYEKLVFDHASKSDSGDSFSIDAVKIYDVVEEENKVKIFAKHRNQICSLYQNNDGQYVLYDVSKYETFLALSYEKKGSKYNFEKEEYPLDGGLYEKSIRDICVKPVSAEKLDNLAEKIMNDRSDDLKNKVDKLLKEHLKENDIDDYEFISN